MHLSKNFSLWEFFVNETPASFKENGAKYAERIKTQLVDRILQPMRDDIKLPITITSGYRCEEHNARVRGKSTSHHLFLYDTCACDITCSDLETAWRWLEEHPRDFCYTEKYILGNFIHIEGLNKVKKVYGKMQINVMGALGD